jgi:hypothetical protein
MGETVTAPGRSADRDGRDAALRVRPGGWPPQRTPWLVLAVLLMAGGGLTGAVLVSNAASRSPVVAVAGDLQRGDRLSRSDVRVVAVGLDEQVPVIAADRIDEVVGRTLAASLPAGSLLSEGLLSRGDALPDDADVVGMLLEAGAYPVADLTVGDRMRVIAVGTETDRDGPMGWLTDAEVYAVDEPTTGSGARFV